MTERAGILMFGDFAIRDVKRNRTSFGFPSRAVEVYNFQPKTFQHDAHMKQSFKREKDSFNTKNMLLLLLLLDKFKADRWVFRNLSINFCFCYEANHEKCQLPECI